VAIRTDWDQNQRDKALQKKLLGRIETHHDFATDKTRFRYIDPKDGRYYDEEVEGRTDEKIDFAMQKAMELLAKQVEAEEKRKMQDAMEGRDVEQRKAERWAKEAADATDRAFFMEQYKQHEEMGDYKIAEYWLQKAMAIEAKQPPDQREYPKAPGTLTGVNTVKASIHKDAHFPTAWIGEAIDRAEKSDKCITFAIEREGIVVTAMEAGEKFAVKVTDWVAMEKSEVNPLLFAIEDCERKLDLLQKMKAKVA